MSNNFHKGDILTVQSSDSIIIHGCNAKGVMGSGMALAIKYKYPKAYETYVRDISLGYIGLGGVSWYCPNVGTIDEGFTICSAITQDNYGRDPNVRYVSYDGVDSCFDEIFKTTKDYNMNYHMPKIGAGLGNGDWSVIYSIILGQAKKHKIEESQLNFWVL